MFSNTLSLCLLSSNLHIFGSRREDKRFWTEW
jgi:hypothetical protein